MTTAPCVTPVSPCRGSPPSTARGRPERVMRSPRPRDRTARRQASSKETSDERRTRGQAPLRLQTAKRVSLEVLFLGLISGLRPATSMAAVVALLRAPAAARTLLAFVVAGLSASAMVGLVVIVAFNGAATAVGGSTFSGLFDLVAGVAALGFAVGVERGRVPRRRERPRGRVASAIAVRLREPSVATAAAAGVATH